jgi:hypothetical protein
MFTSHYEVDRCFEETRDGSFGVVVHGDWLPRHIKGRLHILFATCRNLWLALRVSLRPEKYDVFIVDQVWFYLRMVPDRPMNPCALENISVIADQCVYPAVAPSVPSLQSTVLLPFP